MPFGRAGVGHGLQLAVFGAERRAQVQRLLAHAGVAQRQRGKACVGQLGVCSQAGVHHASLVKHKAAAGVMRLADRFKVLQDAAVELVHITQAGFAHQDGGFLATNAAGAKTHHRLAFQGRPVRRQGRREFGELVDAPIDGAVESAAVRLEGVARVQRDHGLPAVVVPLVQPALERGGIHRRCAALGRSNGRVVHADDLGLDLDQQLFERLRLRPAFFGLQVCKTAVCAQPG